MLKKMTLLAMSIGALVAFAVPATAGAAELEGAKVGELISASGSNTEMSIPGIGMMHCTHVVFYGEVSSNSEEIVEVHGAPEGSPEDVMSGCAVNNTPVFLIPTFEALVLDGTEGEIAFSLRHITEGGICTMASTTSSLSWVAEASWLHFETTVVPTKGGCMGGFMYGDLALENVSRGEPVTIN